MPQTVPAEHAALLATLKDRHQRQLVVDKPYEAMMYAARIPPTPATLAHLVRFTRDERDDVERTPPIPEDRRALDAIGRILASMQWPDPAPLAQAAALLPDWDTLHLTTLLHTAIPDYPIWGPLESEGLRRVGRDVPYDAHAQRAAPPYAHYIDAIKLLREEASFDQVPESHHYLTRIVQAALAQHAQEARR